MLKYSQLTEEQKAKISNGCGAAKVALQIPQFIFEASCRQHDFYYWRGGNIFDKIRGDFWFYYYMIKDLGMEDCIMKKVFYFLMATIYYIMVSVLGIFFFNWGKQRTMSDLTK